MASGLYALYGLVWLVTLAMLLQRGDFDPITKLTWVIVVIFVPFFGIILFWFIAPSSHWSPKEKIDPSNQLSGTPWEKDPGYTKEERF